MTRIVSILLLTLTIGLTFCSAADNSTKLRESLSAVNDCMLQSVYSFIYPASYPPTTIDGLRNSCRSQTIGLKCVKEGSKNVPAILRRGLLTFVQNRQRYHKKYCTNVNSELSKQFVRDLKCVMDKKAAAYRAIDVEYSNSLVEIRKRNYRDSAQELKYLCCSIFNYRRSIIDGVDPECSSSKAQVEEMIFSIVPNDVSLICEDEDKMMTKVCPKLEPLNLSKIFNPRKEDSPQQLALYLIATLGEPEETATR